MTSTWTPRHEPHPSRSSPSTATANDNRTTPGGCTWSQDALRGHPCTRATGLENLPPPNIPSHGPRARAPSHGHPRRSFGWPQRREQASIASIRKRIRLRESSNFFTGFGRVMRESGVLIQRWRCVGRRKDAAAAAAVPIIFLPGANRQMIMMMEWGRTSSCGVVQVSVGFGLVSLAVGR